MFGAIYVTTSILWGGFLMLLWIDLQEERHIQIEICKLGRVTVIMFF